MASLEDAVSGLDESDRSRCQVVAADVSSHSESHPEVEGEYVRKAVEKWGRLDVCVLNAGVCEEPRGIIDTEVKSWERMMSVNALGSTSEPRGKLRLG